MSESSTNVSGSIDAADLLGVAFVILKLTHVIDWSWWWVTAPFWGGAALVILIVGAVLAFAGTVALIGNVMDRRRAARKS